MRLMFVYWAFEDQGSGLLIQGYTRAAKALGHEVAVYGRPNPKIPLNYSLDVESADAIVFIFEWTTKLQQGDSLDLVRLMSRLPRHRRVILDGDGNYNDLVRVGADYNHRDEAERLRWVEVCDSLTDKVCQPTLHPLRPNVRTFLFYSYNPSWEVPLDFRDKEYSMLYVGHSKFRWGPMERVLRAIEPVRDRVGRLGVVGHGWDALPAWAAPMKMEDAYYTDVAYLKRLGVEFLPPVPFEQVVAWMSKAAFNPVISRPTFNRMRLVTPRFFETPAASTIPLFGLDDAYVAEIYGQPALELVLPAAKPEDKILDLLRRPDHYAGIVRGIRRHLAARHSQAARLKELIEIVES
jgi:glycosyltransferase involved in cell wall biosynthesis